MSLDSKLIFYGEYDHSLDDKGRLALPSSFREELGRSERPDILIAWAYGGYLTLYAEKHWRELLEKIEETTPDTSLRNQTLRGLASSGRSLTLDKAGRVLISSDQRVAAGLNREVKILGLGSKIQIWDLAVYKLQAAQDMAVLDEIYKTKGLNF